MRLGLLARHAEQVLHDSRMRVSIWPNRPRRGVERVVEVEDPRLDMAEIGACIRFARRIVRGNMGEAPQPGKRVTSFANQSLKPVLMGALDDTVCGESVGSGGSSDGLARAGKLGGAGCSKPQQRFLRILDERTQAAQRRTCGPSPMLRPKCSYFLAGEGDAAHVAPRRRRQFATPAHANRRSPTTPTTTCARELARKIGRIMPISRARRARQAASADHRDAGAARAGPVTARPRRSWPRRSNRSTACPEHVIKRLARDVEKIVALRSSNIRRCCPMPI